MLSDASFEKTAGKEEIAYNEQFLLFPQFSFCPPGKLCAIFIEFEIVVCKRFQLLKCVIWERVKE